MNLEKKTSYEILELQNMQLDFSHDEIIKNLENDDCEDFIKIFSILNLEKFNSLKEVELLFHHLTNHPTPIREVVALKIEEIYSDEYFSENIKEQFLKSIIDINPNVCRAICNKISTSQKLKEELGLCIVDKINQLLKEIKDNDEALGSFYDNASKIRKNHAKNKKLFSLYWYLESFSIYMSEKTNSEALEIVKQTIKFNDYTIREKTAKILANIENVPNELLKIANEDINFYVKNQVYDKINFEE